MLTEYVEVFLERCCISLCLPEALQSWIYEGQLVKCVLISYCSRTLEGHSSTALFSGGASLKCE